MRISDWSSDVCSSDLVESPTHEEAEYVEKKLMDPNQHPPSPAHEEARTEEEDIEPEDEEEEEEEEDEDVAQLSAAPEAIDVTPRSEERRVGKGGVSTCRSRWSPDH